jgi:hypothetical protein
VCVCVCVCVCICVCARARARVCVCVLFPTYIRFLLRGLDSLKWYKNARFIV